MFCDPFIFRNRLYLFNRFGTSLLCIAISGSDRAEVRILNTYPDGKSDRPNNRYANRCLLLLDEILLVYCHQRLDKPDEEPQLWKLELGPMKWHRLQLLLNHHLPMGRVCLRQAAFEPTAFLHGECGRSTCQEKAHLYQISLEQECVKVHICFLGAPQSIIKPVCSAETFAIKKISLQHSTNPLLEHRLTFYSEMYVCVPL
ncbi:unnamed protein product [Toxocara canis]|uniref:Uncharacterized protein n=1 Tax=Toxocara canis TaxID=6265 RepID=A0A3P7GWJ0_TOXCA|nr:unnamed protein product [Toxocara canis]